MFKIWAKTIKSHKITQSYIYHSADKFDSEEFLQYLTEICHDMDIPTPVILKSKFRKEDFVESVPFDLLQLENAGD